MQFAVFTKSFQDLPIPRVCAVMQEIGADGLDLTVRPGGHIDPDDVEAELPKAARAAEENGIRILMLTTAITTPDEESEKLVAAADQLGIQRIKLGYFRYGKFGTLRRQLDQVRSALGRIVTMTKQYDVLPCVHIHSGGYIPSHGTMLYELLRDFPPDRIGAYVDPLHMAKEGGGQGWRQGLDLLGPWLGLSSMKNCQWLPTHRDKAGQQRWRTKVVPVADGIAPIPDYLADLKKLEYNGVVSMHSEYKGGGSWKDLDTEACIQQTATDLEFVRGLV